MGETGKATKLSPVWVCVRTLWENCLICSNSRLACPLSSKELDLKLNPVVSPAMRCRKTGEDGSEEVECTRAMELGQSPSQLLLSMKSIQLLEHHNLCKSKWGGCPENILTLQSFLTVNAGRVYRSLVSPLSGLCSSPPCLQSLRGWDHVCEKQPQLWSPAPVLSGEEKPWIFRTIQPLWNYWKPSAKNQMTVSHRYKPDVGIPRLCSSKPQPSYAHPHPAWRWQPGEKGHAAGIALLQQMTCLSSSSVHITRTMTTRKDGGMSCQELRPL